MPTEDHDHSQCGCAAQRSAGRPRAAQLPGALVGRGERLDGQLGFDVAVRAGEGRLSSVFGFLDRVPSAG
jgi:hypothetical protein